MAGYFEKFRQALFMPARVLSWAISSVIVGFAGPFGTFDHLALPLRLAYWSAIIALSIIIVTAIRTWLRFKWPKMPFWRHASIASVLTASIFSPIVFAVTPPLLSPDAAFIPFWQLFLVVLSITLGVHALIYIMHPDARRSADPLSRIMRRLPADLRAPLLRLTGRNHTVEVATEKGATTLRMRLSDAIDEADGCDGLCVHRSHWVTKHAIVGSKRENGRYFLTLSDGYEVPVSRKYQPNVEAAGLLENAETTGVTTELRVVAGQ